MIKFYNLYIRSFFRKIFVLIILCISNNVSYGEEIWTSLQDVPTTFWETGIFEGNLLIDNDLISTFLIYAEDLGLETPISHIKVNGKIKFDENTDFALEEGGIQSIKATDEIIISDEYNIQVSEDCQLVCNGNITIESGGTLSNLGTITTNNLTNFGSLLNYDTINIAEKLNNLSILKCDETIFCKNANNSGNLLGKGEIHITDNLTFNDGSKITQLEVDNLSYLDISANSITLNSLEIEDGNELTLNGDITTTKSSQLKIGNTSALTIAKGFDNKGTITINGGKLQIGENDNPTAQNLTNYGNITINSDTESRPVNRGSLFISGNLDIEDNSDGKGTLTINQESQANIRGNVTLSNGVKDENGNGRNGNNQDEVTLNGGYFIVNGNMTMDYNAVLNYNSGDSYVLVYGDLHQNGKTQGGGSNNATIKYPEDGGTTFKKDKKGNFIVDGNGNKEVDQIGSTYATLVVQGTYYDNTDLSENKGGFTHPWEFVSTEFDLQLEYNFTLAVNSYDYQGKKLGEMRNGDYGKILDRYITELTIEIEALQEAYDEGYRIVDYRQHVAQIVDVIDYLTKLKGHYEELSEDLKHIGTTEYLEQLREFGYNADLVQLIIDEISIILPIELTYFTVTNINEEIEFEWETASEVNNDYFTLEYSTDGVHFKEVIKIRGNGTTSETNYYHYTTTQDKFNGLTYFRLKQTDFNGEYTYSDITTLSLESNEQIFVYPNPTTDIISVSEEGSHATIIDIHNRRMNVPQISNKSFNVSDLPQGLYFVQITIQGAIQVLSFVKE